MPMNPALFLVVKVPIIINKSVNKYTCIIVGKNKPTNIYENKTYFNMSLAKTKLAIKKSNKCCHFLK